LIEAARTLVVIVPGDLETLTGGYGYDRRIIAALRDRGWQVAVETLDGSFPQPTAAARQWAVSVLGDIPDDTTVLIDGLAFGVLPAEVEREQARLRLVALVHHPLGAETGLDGGTASLLKDSERRALAAARRVIVTSRATASALGDYGVAADRIATIEPGTDRAPLAHGSGGESVRLLCVASVIPRKGHETLIRALATLPDRRWHLTCVGSVDRDRVTGDRVRTLVRDYDLIDRVTFTGDLRPAELGVEYDHADVFVLPTFYEGYGMAVAEALARGLPVVATATGGIRDLVAEDAGILVPAGNVALLAGALTGLVGDAGLRSRLASGARRVRDRLPTWDEAAGQMSAALESVSVDG
jgi:glycosyltransferase involved in cell wall biosynthesis